MLILQVNQYVFILSLVNSLVLNVVLYLLVLLLVDFKLFVFLFEVVELVGENFVVNLEELQGLQFWLGELYPTPLFPCVLDYICDDAEVRLVV